MENKLEQLLNSLIEKGWKPFGFRWQKTRIEIERDKELDIQIFKLNYTIIERHNRISWSLRNLTSKESWLWQFCVENGMVGDKEDLYSRDLIDEGRDYIPETYSSSRHYEFRVLTSALIDESELERFILNNIKVDEKD